MIRNTLISNYESSNIISSLANQTCIWSDKLTIQYSKNYAVQTVHCYSNFAGCKVLNSGIVPKITNFIPTCTCGIYNTVHVVYDAYQHKFPPH